MGPIPGRDKNFSLCCYVQPGSGGHSAYSTGNQLCEAEQTLPSSVEIRNKCSCTFIHPYILMVRCSISMRNNFLFYNIRKRLVHRKTTAAFAAHES
jgi:hypothetical protein